MDSVSMVVMAMGLGRDEEVVEDRYTALTAQVELLFIQGIHFVLNC